MASSTISANLQQGLSQVEALLSQTLSGSQLEAAVNAMCLRVVGSGGKRLRPKLALLCACALPDGKIGSSDVAFAASVELLHTATLVHDDVIDRATVRRGITTLNETEGNHAAVLAGDYLFTRCYALVQDLDCPALYKMISDTLSCLTIGEINQLKNQGRTNLSVQDYRQTVYAKTGALFELASGGPALLRHDNENCLQALRNFGRTLGMGFQIIDDLLDYNSNATTLGKNIGEDLKEGRITLPVILARQELDESGRSALDEAVAAVDFEAVQQNLIKTGALERSREYALSLRDEALRSLEILPDSDAVEALREFARAAIERKF